MIKRTVPKTAQGMNFSKMIKEIVNKVPLEYEKCLGYDRKCESILVSSRFLFRSLSK